MKFNVALIPDSDTSQALIKLAQEIKEKFELKTEYLLKGEEEGSIPHVSVLQFEIEYRFLSEISKQKQSEDFLALVWKHVLETWDEILKENSGQPLVGMLPKKINIKHDSAGAFSGVSWVELVIDKEKNGRSYEKYFQALDLFG